jgi:hypothetical protein
MSLCERCSAVAPLGLGLFQRAVKAVFRLAALLNAAMPVHLRCTQYQNAA